LILTFQQTDVEDGTEIMNDDRTLKNNDGDESRRLIGKLSLSFSFTLTHISHCLSHILSLSLAFFFPHSLSLSTLSTLPLSLVSHKHTSTLSNSNSPSHTSSLHHSDPSIAAVVESNLRAALEKSYIQEHTVKLKVQIDSIANYIAEQTAFLASLKNSISKQSRLHNQLIAKLSQLDPSCITGQHMFE
jgi:hypothetical protein